jgi:hypothetical protein
MVVLYPHCRDLRRTPKPDYDSDSDGVGVGVGISKAEFSGVGVGIPNQNFSGSEAESVIEKKFRSQIGVKVIITSNKVLRFYEPVTSFFISINIKKTTLTTQIKNDF